MTLTREQVLAMASRRSRKVIGSVDHYFFFTPNFRPLIVADFVVTLYTSLS